MNPSIRNEDGRGRVTITLDPQGGVRIEEKTPENEACIAPDYGDYLRMLRGHGTVCYPRAASSSIPSPVFQPSVGGVTCSPLRDFEPRTNLSVADPAYTEHFGLEQGLNCELIPADEIQQMWNQVLADSSRQIMKQTVDQSRHQEESKTKKLELLLRLALNSGDMDTAMLLFSGLESRQANEVSAGLMKRMQQLQDQRKSLVKQMAPTGDQSKDAQNSQKVQADMSDIGTEMSLLQTFLQDIQSRKNEAQQMASNFIKSRHDTGMGIIRNMG